MDPYSLFLINLVAIVLIGYVAIRLRESAGEVGSNVFEITSIETGRGARCELVDCPHNAGAQLVSKALRLGGKDTASVDKIEVYQGACSIDSHGVPILDVMNFIGYCPEYDGERHPGVRDITREGKTRWDNFLKREPFWLRDRGGAYEFSARDMDGYWRGIPLQYPFLGWVFTEEEEERYEEIVREAEAEAREKTKKSEEKNK